MARKLPYAVECKSTYPFFETIAAFDCSTAAEHYAADCRDSNAREGNTYRVTKGKKVLVTFTTTRAASHVG